MRGIAVREEREADCAAVHRIHEAAFGQPGEARLVESLRVAVSPQISLVAEFDGEPAGGWVRYHEAFAKLEA